MGDGTHGRGAAILFLLYCSVVEAIFFFFFAGLMSDRGDALACCAAISQCFVLQVNVTGLLGCGERQAWP